MRNWKTENGSDRSVVCRLSISKEGSILHNNTDKGYAGEPMTFDNNIIRGVGNTFNMWVELD